MPPSTAIERSASAAPRRSWIPYVFVVGMAIVFAMNAALVWFALSTWTGLVAERPYERGVAYNRVLEAEARQAALGWRAEIAFTPRPGATNAGTIAITILDHEAKGLAGLVVEVSVERPLENLAPIRLEPVYAGAGRYVAEVELPRRGQWNVSVHAAQGGDSLIAVNRIVVP